MTVLEQLELESVLGRMQQAYGASLPPWMVALAEACDGDSITAVANALGYSRTTVSLVVSGAYGSDLTEVKRRVGRILMGPLNCPVLGEISDEACRSNQALPYSNANAGRVALYRACRRGCIHSSIKKGS